ncbi:MAG: beta-lactamase family protein [bacterium]|nr:beta-lactamase family protein [bacterium]
MDPNFTELRQEIQRQVSEGIRPSVQVAVNWRGKLVFDEACGEGATPESSYLLWSATKPLIAIALLQLVEEGAVDLDDRIDRTIPEFGQNGKERATLVHLLSHRGGFPDNSPSVRRELWKHARDWNAALDFVCKMKAAWKPGSDRGYHPMSGWFVVGELIRRLDGRELPHSLRERVLDPLGISEDGFCLGEPEKLLAAPMTVHTRDERGAPRQSEADYFNDPLTHAAVIPGGGGIARARDLVKFYRALLDGGQGAKSRILKSETVRLATFPHAVGIPDRTFLRDVPWGLGFHLKHVRPSLDDCGTLATPGTFGHGGHFLVNTSWADPGRDLACCILANGLSESRLGIRSVRALSDAVHRAIDRAVAGAQE